MGPQAVCFFLAACTHVSTHCFSAVVVLVSDEDIVELREYVLYNWCTWLVPPGTGHPSSPMF